MNYGNSLLIIILEVYYLLLTSRYFHVCDGGLVPDVMHDILEGALQYEVKLLLKRMVETNKYFSLGEETNE